MAPVVEGVPRPVSVPKGSISVSTKVQADRKPNPQLRKYTNIPLSGEDWEMGVSVYSLLH